MSQPTPEEWPVGEYADLPVRLSRSEDIWLPTYVLTTGDALVRWSTDNRLIGVAKARLTRVAPPPQAAVTFDPREPEAVIMSLDLVAFRPDTPSMADTIAGVGLWHLAHLHEVRTHITLTGHVVSVIVTLIAPDTAPAAARSAKFVVPCHAAEVAAVLDPLIGA